MSKADAIIEHKSTTTNQILLIALLAAVGPDRLSYRYDDLLEVNLTPTLHLSKKILTVLRDSGLIEIEEPLSEGSKTVLFQFPNNNEILKRLLENLQESQLPRTGKIEILTQDIMAAECQQFIAYIASSYGISTSIDFPPHPLLMELLCKRSMRAVHKLLWQSIKTIMDQNGRIIIALNDTESLFSRVIKKAYVLNENYRNNFSTINSFERSGRFKTSILASVVFEYVFGCGNGYYDDPDIFVNGGMRQQSVLNRTEILGSLG